MLAIEITDKDEVLVEIMLNSVVDNLSKVVVISVSIWSEVCESNGGSR